MVKNHDFMSCAGNICETDPDKEFRTWFPDEPICSFGPRPKWLKNMARIQKLYLKGKLTADRYFTWKMLSKMKAVRRPRGIDPDQPIKQVKLESKPLDNVRSLKPEPLNMYIASI